MTEKEKAQQLYKRFCNEIGQKPNVNGRASAIAAVDLMLTEFKEIEFNYGYELIDDIAYWGRVKQELENM